MSVIDLGDRAASSIIDFKFVTTNSAGAPTALTGGTIKVYKANATTTETTTGITHTTPFDSTTGLHHVRIALSADTSFYAVANDYQVVITAGTVDGVSVVGYVVAQFSIQNRCVGQVAGDVTGDISGSVFGKVVGSGSDDIVGVGAWVRDSSGATLTAADTANILKVVQAKDRG